MIDSGIRYCIVHDGIIEQDQTDCDFSRQDPVDYEGECISRPLLYAALDDKREHE